jgi:hypothetical protein
MMPKWPYRFLVWMVAAIFVSSVAACSGGTDGVEEYEYTIHEGCTLIVHENRANDVTDVRQECR